MVGCGGAVLFDDDREVAVDVSQPRAVVLTKTITLTITKKNLKIMEITVNEWMRADGVKWIDREVLVRFFDNTVGIAKWNGRHWMTQSGDRVLETVGHFITHYYVYEKFKDSER